MFWLSKSQINGPPVLAKAIKQELVKAAHELCYSGAEHIIFVGQGTVLTLQTAFEAIQNERNAKSQIANYPHDNSPSNSALSSTSNRLNLLSAENNVLKYSQKVPKLNRVYFELQRQLQIRDIEQNYRDYVVNSEVFDANGNQRLLIVGTNDAVVPLVKTLQEIVTAFSETDSKLPYRFAGNAQALILTNLMSDLSCTRLQVAPNLPAINLRFKKISYPLSNLISELTRCDPARHLFDPPPALEAQLPNYSSPQIADFKQSIIEVAQRNSRTVCREFNSLPLPPVALLPARLRVAGKNFMQFLKGVRAP
jgi:hypothetical protein